MERRRERERREAHLRPGPARPAPAPAPRPLLPIAVVERHLLVVRHVPHHLAQTGAGEAREREGEMGGDKAQLGGRAGRSSRQGGQPSGKGEATGEGKEGRGEGGSQGVGPPPERAARGPRRAAPLSALTPSGGRFAAGNIGRRCQFGDGLSKRSALGGGARTPLAMPRLVDGTQSRVNTKSFGVTGCSSLKVMGVICGTPPIPV